MRSTPVYAPDGMAGFSAARARFDAYDDGLVHNHNWAASSHHQPAPVGFGGMPASSRVRAYDVVHAHERFDDGLVHNHGWAARGN